MNVSVSRMEPYKKRQESEPTKPVVTSSMRQMMLLPTNMQASCSFLFWPPLSFPARLSLFKVRSQAAMS